MPSFLGGHQECHYRGSGISTADPWTADLLRLDLMILQDGSVSNYMIWGL